MPPGLDHGSAERSGPSTRAAKAVGLFVLLVGALLVILAATRLVGAIIDLPGSFWRQQQ